jgi:hypothetical protein
MNRATLVLAAVTLAAACAPQQVRERPIMQTGDRVPSADRTIESARAEAEREQAEAAARRAGPAADALADCAPAICEAIARGEVALGMTEPQVLAATRTTGAAWTARDAGPASVLVPASLQHAPRDALGQLAMIQLRDGRVAAYSYQESQGIRLVASPQDATLDGRARALAEMLIREGDDYAARGDLNAALDRYDRADVLMPGSPELDYRIASVLDKQLRPIEALMRYQLFLHRLELERIDAVGRAYGYLADAIAQARQRIIILERQTR